MNERQTRQIAQDEYQALGSRFGVNQTPVHSHDNIGSPKLEPTSLTNVEVLSPQSGGVLAASGTPTNFTKNQQVAVFPIPILNTAAPSGSAPEGTLVIASHLGTTKLYGRVGGVWVDLTGL